MDNLKEIIIGTLGEVKPDIGQDIGKRFVTEGILDSLDIVNLIMIMEETFNIEIPPEDVVADNFETIDAIADLIQRCKKQ